ncbi:zinc finger protein basonuclin-2-like isoform X2 [Brachyhypopomus gauderio]|uniref:zinc finger protein basonuclin-2-like isoform X2 n=1 Tax=Brachyhypopomus gauderio TaxID=698409 RepID=UPI0040414439
MDTHCSLSRDGAEAGAARQVQRRERGDWLYSSSTSSTSQVIGCTQANCTCDGFQPGQLNLRSCDRCAHGWVTHAVSKLCSGSVFAPGQVEMVQPSVVFDISSVLLYGTQAVPVRMKILLDRLFSVLTHTQVLTILHTLGWTLRDYIRGYILQDSAGKVLDRWVTMTLEDEVVALNQFMRFGETKPIVELMVVQEQQGRQAAVSRATRVDSDIRLFIESNSPRCRLQTGEGVRGQAPPGLHHFESLPGGALDFLQLFQYSRASTAAPLTPLTPLPTFQPQAPTATRRLRQPRQTKQNHGTDGTEAADTRTTAMVGEPTGEGGGASVSPHTLPCAHNARQQGSPANGQTPAPSSSSSSSSSATWVRRPGSSVRRVSCGACGKSFYDKGTLKIHYNAVHLQIKHRCTVEGCSMIFSSLRSRNRHSANPNPRLHAPACTRPHTPHTQPAHAALPGPVKPPLGTTPPDLPRAPPSIPRAPHTPLILPSGVSVAPSSPTVLSLKRPPDVMPPQFAITTATHQHLEKPCACVCDCKVTPHPEGFTGSANQSRFLTTTDTTPKKKSRKSRMPVKIKRETLNEQDSHDNRSHDNRGHDNRGHDNKVPGRNLARVCV